MFVAVSLCFCEIHDLLTLLLDFYVYFFVLCHDVPSIGCLWLLVEMGTWRVYARIKNPFELMDSMSPVT